ncbi:hypothetical protein HMPREF9123_0222 [Neisseria bacilliformis ATCC BAA-1200]|uniref:Uncharacterized protein n=1 Tax=Neisseria bacilliformis ATCC BAA-1200 TaxID=888742 RepID=F2B912_9NEIS|nr:hypothetical protein HMPREF9123_0222 [Neisseria bacilliformis ATCC BAA-1200]
MHVNRRNKGFPPPLQLKSDVCLLHILSTSQAVWMYFVFRIHLFGMERCQNSDNS